MLQDNFLPREVEENDSCHVGSLFSQEQSDETSTQNSTPQYNPPGTERIADWVASLPATDDSVEGRSDTGDLESALERLTNSQDQETENGCPQFNSRIIPPNSTDTQDGVCTDGTMPGARERHRAISALSISSAPPNVSEVVTRVRTQVGRLIRPVNRLIQNMTQKTIHNAVSDCLSPFCYRKP